MATILVLDDDTRFRHLAATILETRGHKILEAPNARSAMSIAEEQAPDLAIVDYRLTDIDGLQWITWLREKGISIPVIFISGFHCDEIMLNRLRNVLHVSLILQKPIDPYTFNEQVDDVLHEAELKFTTWRGGSTMNASARQNDVIIPTLSSEENLDFDELINEYASELPTVLKDIGDLIQLAEINPDQFGLLDGIIERLHKLRGTSGTYGQPEVGDIAGNIEDILRRVQNEELALSPQIWDEIKTAIQEAETKAESFVAIANAVNSDAQTFPIPQPYEEQPKPPRLLVDEHGNCTIVHEPTAMSSVNIPVMAIETAPTQMDVSSQSCERDVDRPIMLLFDTCESRTQQLVAVAGTRAIKTVIITCLDDAKGALSQGDIAFVVLNANAQNAPEAVAIMQGLHERENGKKIPIIFSAHSFSLYEHALAAQAGATLCIDELLTATNFDRVVQQLFKAVNIECPRVVCLGPDDNSLAEVVARLTKDGINTVSLSDGAEVLKLISSFQPHLLLILDASNPSISGFDICRAIKDGENFRDIAVVFYTDTATSRFRLAAANAGADDFIQRGADWLELLTRIGRHAQNAKSRMARLGSDALTGLLLPSSLMHRLESLLGDCQQEQKPFTLCRMAICNLHSIDVTAGYNSVNEALKIVGTIVTVKLREQAVCGNSAGEFILAFPCQNKDSVLLQIKQLTALVESVRVHDESGEPIALLFNYQIASYPTDGLTLPELLESTHVSKRLVNA
ncbi:MAG: response regulator [Candidatus Obscuribacterales bacterium]|nr:response regulator [Candidatus Obscuribacterales bacterium]